MHEKLLTIEEVAQYLELSTEAVRKLVERGDLPAYKIGGVILRFKREQVEDYLRRHDSAILTEKALSQNTDAKSDYADRKRLWIDRKRTSGQNNVATYTFLERLEDFLYYNDFYILSLILLILIIFAVFGF